MRAKWVLRVPLLLLGGLFARPAPAADEPTKEQIQNAQEYLKQIGIAFHSYADDHESKWADDITDKDGQPAPLLARAPPAVPRREEAVRGVQARRALGLRAQQEARRQDAEGLRAGSREGEAGRDVLPAVRRQGRALQREGVGLRFPRSPTARRTPRSSWRPATRWSGRSSADLLFAGPKGRCPGSARPFDGDFHVLLCDGSVAFFKKDFDADEMKKVVMPDDGQPIDFKKLTK